MLRMDQVNVIRHKVLIEGQSIRRVAREMGLSRLTVPKYVERSEPMAQRYTPRARPVWERVRPHLEELLVEWEPRTTVKQRLTGVRLHRALREDGHQVGLTMIHAYLRERRRQRAEVYVPLVHHPGEAAGRFFRGGGGGRRRAAQGVAVPFAADVLGARVRLAVRTLRPARVSGRPRAGVFLSGGRDAALRLRLCGAPHNRTYVPLAIMLR